MASASRFKDLIEENSFVSSWFCNGGFGVVLKARHKVTKAAVAVKWLRKGLTMLEPSDLLKEAMLMESLACPFVVSLYGLCLACQPASNTPEEAIVMEFMDGGSIESLLKTLKDHPPWPLAFRFALHIAQGMNFLHSLRIAHLDLKPSNVLLDKDLNAKIADFGLSQASMSAESPGKIAPELRGGTFKYMPPEAFRKPYQPTRKFDLYSYAILMFSVLTGKDPFPGHDYSYQAAMIGCEKNRPNLKEIDPYAPEGTRDLICLMQRCWAGTPSLRPSFEEVVSKTKPLYEKYESGIHEVVADVWKRMHLATSGLRPEVQPRDQANGPPQQDGDTVDLKRLKDSAVSPTMDQEAVTADPGTDVLDSELSIKAKAKFVQKNRDAIVQNMTRIMTVVGALGDIVGPVEYNMIRDAMPNQKKVRELYRLCLPRDLDEFNAAFYDVLKQHQKELMAMLER